MKGPAAHLLLPCRSESVHTVRALLHREPVLMVRWSLVDGLFTFSVQDRGPGLDNSRLALSRRAHPSQSRGRGLYVMQAVMDRVVVDSSLNGTRILLEKTLDAPAAG